MKKLMIIVAIIGWAGASFAQIENIQLSKTVTVDKLYAGMLSGVNFSVDSLHVKTFAGVRLGALVTWRPSKYIAVSSMGVHQLEAGSSSWTTAFFHITVNPIEALTISIGNMGTLATEQRPYPASAGGQFETFTEAQIPGAALCAKASLMVVKDKLSIGAAIAERNGKAEYQLNVSWPKKFTVSAFYDDWNKEFGTAVSANFWRISEVFVWRQGNVVSNLFQLHLGRDRDWNLYSDTGYDLAKGKLVRGEWGILKEFSSKHAKGLIGPGYCHEDRSVYCYLFVHL